MLMLQNMLKLYRSASYSISSIRYLSSGNPPNSSKKEEIMKKKTPAGKLDETEKDVPYVDKALPRHPGGVNQKTGEVGGPAGLEPTRFGDWERKGRMLCNLIAEASINPKIAIETALIRPDVFNVAELLAIPAVQELKNTDPIFFQTLQVFAYGTYTDLPPQVNVNASFIHKLRQLTLINMATKNRQITYQSLIESCQLSNIRELESLVIDAINNNLIKAKINAKQKIVEVDDWKARDVPHSEIPSLISSLGEWIEKSQETIASSNVLATNEDIRVNNDREASRASDEQLEGVRRGLEQYADRVGASGSGAGGGAKRKVALRSRAGLSNASNK